MATRPYGCHGTGHRRDGGWQGRRRVDASGTGAAAAGAGRQTRRRQDARPHRRRTDRTAPSLERRRGRLVSATHLFQDRKPKPGDRFELATFDPEVNAVVNLRVAVKDAEEVNVLGVRKKLLRIEMVPDKLAGPGFSVQRPTTVLWLDDAFVPVRRQVEFDGLGSIILTRCTRAIATAAPGETPTRVTDVNARNLVPAQSDDLPRTPLAPPFTASHCATTPTRPRRSPATAIRM